jgi:hypothetical protein
VARRLASLATDTDAATPTEQVMPCSSWMVERSRSAIWRGGPRRRVEPRTSRNASSSETTSTTGVTSRKVSMTEAETLVNVV